MSTVYLLVLIGLAAFALAALLQHPQFRIVLRKKRTEPPAVKVSSDLLNRFRSELVHNASKRIVKADFQRGYRR